MLYKGRWQSATSWEFVIDKPKLVKGLHELALARKSSAPAEKVRVKQGYHQPLSKVFTPSSKAAVQKPCILLQRQRTQKFHFKFGRKSRCVDHDLQGQNAAFYFVWIWAWQWQEIIVCGEVVCVSQRKTFQGPLEDIWQQDGNKKKGRQEKEGWERGRQLEDGNKMVTRGKERERMDDKRGAEDGREGMTIGTGRTFALGTTHKYSCRCRHCLYLLCCVVFFLFW